MEQLTLERLKELAPHAVIAEGYAADSPTGIHMTGSGKPLRWVAVRGGIHDWAIYCHWADRSQFEVRSGGDKVHDKETIRRLVPCTDEAFAWYRP